MRVEPVPHAGRLPDELLSGLALMKPIPTLAVALKWVASTTR